MWALENSDKEWSVNLRGTLIRNVPPPQAEEEAAGAGREYGVKGRGCLETPNRASTPQKQAILRVTD